MRISDWSSDVCSSDLSPGPAVLTRECVIRPRADVRSSGSGGRHSGRDAGRPHVTLWSDQPMRKAEMGAGRSDDTSLIWEMPSGLMSNDLARSEEHTSELQSLMRISFAFSSLQEKQLVGTYCN